MNRTSATVPAEKLLPLFAVVAYLLALLLSLRLVLAISRSGHL